MLKIVIITLVAAGIFLLMIGVLFQTIRLPFESYNKGQRGLTLFSLLNRITAKKFIFIPLDFISRDSKLWANRLAIKILERSEVGISLHQLYFLKILCLITSTVILLMVSYSNTVYKARIIIEIYDSERTLLNSEISSDHSKYKFYKQIENSIDPGALSKGSYQEQFTTVEEAVSECLNTSDKQLIKEKVQWFIEVYRDVSKLKSLKPNYVILIFFTFFIPEACFLAIWLVRGSIYKREIIKLEYIFELLARVDGVKTLDIVYQLEKSSKIYSKYLQEFSHLFKYDKIRAFDFLKNRNIKSLTKMANILEIYSLTDREIALQVLEREVIERDEAIIMTADENIDFIDLAAFLSIAPLVYELARLMLDPMLDMVYKAFEFI